MFMQGPTRKSYNTSLKTYEQREEVMIFAQNYGRKEALAQYNISLSTFKRWKKEYCKYGGHLDRRYSKPSRLDTYPIQCTIIKQFVLDHKKWVQKAHGEKGIYGLGQWSKVQLINHLYRSIYPRVHLSTVYRLYNEAVKIINNPKTTDLIAWNYDKGTYKY